MTSQRLVTKWPLIWHNQGTHFCHYGRGPLCVCTHGTSAYRLYSQDYHARRDLRFLYAIWEGMQYVCMLCHFNYYSNFVQLSSGN